MNNHGGSADRPQVHRVIFYAMQQHKSGSFARPFALSRTGSQYAVQSLVGKSRGREKKNNNQTTVPSSHSSAKTSHSSARNVPGPQRAMYGWVQAKAQQDALRQCTCVFRRSVRLLGCESRCFDDVFFLSHGMKMERKDKRERPCHFLLHLTLLIMIMIMIMMMTLSWTRRSRIWSKSTMLSE